MEQKLRELIEKQKQYISLLGEELSEVAILASIRGWESSRVEVGAKLRDELAELELRIEELENKNKDNG